MRQVNQPPSKWRNTSNRFLANRAGQVVIEYMLLLVIVSSLGAIIIRDLVSRDQNEPGLLVAKWHSLLKTIAEDNPEE